MINWTKDSWEDVKMLLDELDYDYTTDFKGNLTLHFKDFEIVDENTKQVVDKVDHMWLEFVFSDTSYRILWSRNDIYQSNTNYTHPHVNGSDHCTGNYVKGVSLCRDLLYYTNYVKRYNSGQGWTTIPSSSSARINAEAINKKLIPTFYMDVTLGYPVVSTVEFEGDIQEFITKIPLSNPKSFFWKGEKFTQYNKGSRVEHLNLKNYFDYVKYFERYNNATSSLSDVDVVPEV